MYVMIGAEPTSYVIPFLAATDRFVRIDGNMPFEPDRRLGRRAAALIAEFDGPLRSLVSTEAQGVARAVRPPERARLRRFGLDLVDGSCQSFQSKMDRFWTCELLKLPQQR